MYVRDCVSYHVTLNVSIKPGPLKKKERKATPPTSLSFTMSLSIGEFRRHIFSYKTLKGSKFTFLAMSQRLLKEEEK